MHYLAVPSTRLKYATGPAGTPAPCTTTGIAARARRTARGRLRTRAQSDDQNTSEDQAGRTDNDAAPPFGVGAASAGGGVGGDTAWARVVSSFDRPLSFSDVGTFQCQVCSVVWELCTGAYYCLQVEAKAHMFYRHVMEYTNTRFVFRMIMGKVEKY